MSKLESSRLDELDEGQWLVTHLDQHIATFFILVPETLGLASGQTVASYLPLTLEGIKLLEASPAQVVFQSLDSRDTPPVLLASEELARTTPRIRNWSNKCTLAASLLVHQVQTDPLARSGMDAVGLVAQAASGGGRAHDERQLSVLDLPRQARETETHLSNGTSNATVIEAAVPLRLFGEVPKTEEMLTRPAHVETDPGITYPDLWTFVGTPGIAMSTELLKDRLFAALDVAIDEIRKLQKAYHAITRYPLTLVTCERLPLVTGDSPTPRGHWTWTASVETPCTPGQWEYMELAGSAQSQSRSARQTQLASTHYR